MVGESPGCQRVLCSSPFGVEWAASVLPVADGVPIPLARVCSSHQGQVHLTDAAALPGVGGGASHT